MSLKGPSPAAPGLILDAYQGLCAVSVGWGQSREGTDEGQSAGRRSAGCELRNFLQGYRLIASQFYGNKKLGAEERD